MGKVMVASINNSQPLLIEEALLLIIRILKYPLGSQLSPIIPVPNHLIKNIPILLKVENQY
jgi:hypothetical protein